MASCFQTFGEGASTNRPPLFAGENYPFWKMIMQIFLESQDKEILDATLNGPFVPTKPFTEWTTDENRRAQYDVKARNIMASALTIDEFFRISQCKSAKEMWDVLEVTHEGIDEVKRARKNILFKSMNFS